jgi:four helix bundle protein
MGMQASKKFETFEDLEVYRVARAFRCAMYDVARELPDIEKFGLANQIRRAAVSLTNNLAEGHGRFHYLDQIRFMLQARGSLQELIDDLNVCVDETYLPQQRVTELKEQGWSVARLIGGCIRFLRQQKTGERLALREEPVPYGEANKDSIECFLADLETLPLPHNFATAGDGEAPPMQPFNHSTI